MISLKELEGPDGLRRMKALFIRANEEYNALLAEKDALKKILNKTEYEIESVKKKLETEVIPLAKTRVLDKYKEVMDKHKIAKSEYLELALADPEAVPLVKILNSLELGLMDLKDRHETINNKLESIKETCNKMDKLTTVENTLARIRFGMTRIDVSDYLEEKK